MKKTHISIKENKKTTSLDRYAGQWVAFTNGKVVAYEGTLKRLMKKVKRIKSIRKKPSVLLVPEEKEGPYVI